MSERSTADVLRAAKARIEDPKHWCRGGFAKDANLKKVSPEDKKACKWCALGALAAEKRSVLSPRFSRAGRLLESATAVGNVVSVNDGAGPCSGIGRRQSHKLVLAAYDEAIKQAEATA